MYGGPIIRNATCCYLTCLKEVYVKETLHALSGVAKEILVQKTTCNNIQR